MSNSIKVLLVGVVLAAIGAGAGFVLTGDSEEATGLDATLSSSEKPGDAPTFKSNLVSGPVGEAEVIDEIPAGVPEVDSPVSGSADSGGRRSEKQVSLVEITGRVLDPAGRPVEGATISFVREPMAMMSRSVVGEEGLPDDLLVKTVTDRDGRFSLEGRARQRSNDGGGGGFLSLSRDPQLVVQHESFATLVHECSSLGEQAWDAGDLMVESGAWIVGRVVDSAGRAVAGASVSASSVGEGGRGGRRGMRMFGMSMFSGLGQQFDAVESGSDGRFTVHGLVPGIAHVTASRKGMRLGSVEDVELEARVPTDIGVIVLEEGVSISGVVLGEDGQPLKGASVSVSSMARLMISRIEDMPRGQIGQEMGQRAVTDGFGQFELGGLVGGNYNVHANAEGYDSVTLPDVAAGTRNVRLEPVKLGSLLVTLVSARDGQPVIDATIGTSRSRGGWGRRRSDESSPVLEGEEALAAVGREGEAEGLYLIQYADLESTELTVAAEGFATIKAESQPVASGKVGSMTIELQPESVVAGFVLDAEGNPVERARVTMRAIEPQGDGGFRWRGGRGMSFSHAVTIDIGGDDDGGERPPDAERRRARTGYDGSFEIRGATAGEWELTASAEGFASSSPISLTLAEAQEQRDVEVELVRAGSIGGFVTEVDGTPVDGARVLVESSAGSAQPSSDLGRMEMQLARMLGGGDRGGSAGPWSTHTDATGRYEVSSLAPGDYEVKLDSGPGGRGMRGMMFLISDDSDVEEEVSIRTTVVEGVESRVDLVQPKRSVVRGRVTAGGQPAAEVTVRLRTDSPFAFGGESTVTNAFGEYEFTDVEAGEYVVTSIVPGAALEEETTLEVGEGETLNADIAFGGATLSGRVIDKAGGFGAPGVTLTVVPVKSSESGASFGGGNIGFQIVMESDTGGGRSGMSIDVGGGSISTVKTDASGNFELKYLKPGEYSVEASGGSYTSGSIGPFDLTDGQDKDDLLIEVQKGAIIEGLIHSGETGDRLDKMPVRLNGSDLREMTVTEDGTYRFEGLEPGDYTIEVLGSGWGADAIAGESVTLEEGEVRKLDLITGS